MKDIKGKSEKELLKLLDEKREALRVFRTSMSGGKAKNVRESRTLRKDVARILTELSALAKAPNKA